MIPSLVDEQGNFHRSSYYRQQKQVTFVYEEVRLETIAQLTHFKELTGHYPEHLIAIRLVMKWLIKYF